MALILERPWTSQPQGPVQPSSAIPWTFALLPDGPGVRDVVSGVRYAGTSGVTAAVGGGGRAINGVTNASSDGVALNASDAWRFAGTAGTIFAHVHSGSWSGTNPGVIYGVRDNATVALQITVADDSGAIARQLGLNIGASALAAPNNSVAVGRPDIIACSWGPRGMRLFSASTGGLVASNATTTLPASSAITPWLLNRSTGARGSNAFLYGCFGVPLQLPDSQIVGMLNPGGLYGRALKPRRIFIPVSVAGGSSLDLSASALSITGAVTATGNIGVGVDLSASALSVSGTVSVSGDIQIGTAASLDLSASALSLSGTASVSGDLGIGTAFDLAASAVSVSGTVSIAGDLAAGTGLNLSASPITVSGTLSLSGDILAGDTPATVRKLENWYYRPALVPFSAEAWLVRELNTISRSTYGAAPFVQMVDVTVEPDKPNPGMVVFTTATAWDPGSGAGVYCYRSGAWHLLG